MLEQKDAWDSHMQGVIFYWEIKSEKKKNPVRRLRDL